MSSQPPQEPAQPPMQILQPPRQPQEQQEQPPPPHQPNPPQQQQQQPRSPPPQGGGRQGRGRSPGGRGGQPQYPQQNQGRGGGGRGRGGGPGRGGPPQQQQQQFVKPITLNPSSGVPYGHVPAYLPGSASLVEQLDQRVLIVLRDGKHIIGELSSFDQFSNMILKDAVERRFHSSASEGGMTFYSDIPLGVYVIRGDSVVILGAMADPNRMPPTANLKQVTLEELGELQAKDKSNAKPGEEAENGPLTWDFDTDLIA